MNRTYIEIECTYPVIETRPPQNTTNLESINRPHEECAYPMSRPLKIQQTSCGQVWHITI